MLAARHDDDDDDILGKLPLLKKKKAESVHSYKGKTVLNNFEF